MSNKLKSAISWSIFISILIILFIMIASFVIVILKPTFFPKADISGIENAFNTASALVGFFSAGLGCYSFWKSSKNDKQVEQILQGVNILKDYHDATQHPIPSKPNFGFADANQDDGNSWKPDNSNN